MSSTHWVSLTTLHSTADSILQTSPQGVKRGPPGRENQRPGGGRKGGLFSCIGDGPPGPRNVARAARHALCSVLTLSGSRKVATPRNAHVHITSPYGKFRKSRPVTDFALC